MTLDERISGCTEKLSKVQRNIAAYVMRNLDKACFFTLKELSCELNVTEVTVINFCKKVGYRNFLDFKKDMQATVQNKTMPKEVFLDNLNSFGDDKIDNLIQNDMELLKNAINQLDIRNIRQAIRLINQSTKVFVVCEGVSDIIGAYFINKLSLLGFDAVKYQLSNGMSMRNQVLTVSPNDLFIAISFPRYSKKVISVLGYAAENGNPILSITDKPASPIAVAANVFFTCVSDTPVMTNSITPAIAVSNILLSLLAFENKERVKSNYDLLNKAEKHFDKYF